MNVVARDPDHLDLFAVDEHDRTMSTWWDSTGWADWFQVSGGVASPGSPVTAIALNPHHLVLFTLGTDNLVYTTWWAGRAEWKPWRPIGELRARPGSTVNVVARDPDHLDLFAVDKDGRTMSTWWEAKGKGWAHWWFQVSGGVASPGLPDSPGSPVTAIALNPHHLVLFTLGTDNLVYTTWWAEGSWKRWHSIGKWQARPGSTVNVVARNRDHLDLFAVDEHGRTMSTWWEANSAGRTGSTSLESPDL